MTNPGEGLCSFRQFTAPAAQLAPYQGPLIKARLSRPAYQGQTLGIAFSTLGNSFLNIDNVSLEPIDVSAPATLALFLMGGFALRWKRVRRAQHSDTTQARIVDVRLSACLWRAIFRILLSVDVISMRLIVLA